MTAFISMWGIPALFALLLAGTAARIPAPPLAFHHVIAGTGAMEVQLIAAKLAVRSGDTASIICAADDNFVRRSMISMYGVKKMDDKSEEEGCPQFVSDGDSIGKALAAADGIHIVCEDTGMDAKKVGTILSNAPNVRHVTVLSRMGGKLREFEDMMRQESRISDGSVALSVVRAGALKGGGPGDIEGEEWGLSKNYYDSNFDLGDAMITMSSDRFTLGAKITKGDPFKAPNFFSMMKSKDSFEPSDTDTGRTAAAQALLSAVRRKIGVDVSLSTAKAKVPPTPEEWDALLEAAQ